MDPFDACRIHFLPYCEDYHDEHVARPVIGEVALLESKATIRRGGSLIGMECTRATEVASLCSD